MQHRISIPLKLQVSLADGVPDLAENVSRSQIFELLMRIEDDCRKFCPPGEARAVRVKHENEESFRKKAITETGGIRISRHSGIGRRIIQIFQ